MRKLPIYQVDAFASQVFQGNPAAVVPLDFWLKESQLQQIAAENNLSETAFFVRQENGKYHIRWFTPTNEVDLCGHATLAAAFVIYEFLEHYTDIIEFTSQAGTLKVRVRNERYILDFPKREPHAIGKDKLVEKALGVEALSMALSRDLIVEVANQKLVETCEPDFQALAQLKEYFAIVVTAKAEPQSGIDFVSRFFAPQQGINEDPVTGSSFCSLAPFWQKNFQKDHLAAIQLSERTGRVELDIKDRRVEIAGFARLYMKGDIFIPEVY